MFFSDRIYYIFLSFLFGASIFIFDDLNEFNTGVYVKVYKQGVVFCCM